MTNVDDDRKHRSILSDTEFNLLRAQARVNDFDFLALRNEALLCCLRLFGKRRAEFGSSYLRHIKKVDGEKIIEKTYKDGMRRNEVWVDSHNINFNFRVLKKHGDKPLEIVRRVPVDDPLAQPILAYIKYLDTLKNPVNYFFPSAKNVFGNYIIQGDKNLPSRCVYDVVRDLGDACGVVVWPHLFRETAGGEEIIEDPSQYGVFKVTNRLDITERTAWAYMQRHIGSVVRSRENKNGGVNR